MLQKQGPTAKIQWGKSKAEGLFQTGDEEEKQKKWKPKKEKKIGIVIRQQSSNMQITDITKEGIRKKPC